MPEKLYIIILLGVCFIASGFATTELIRLYNIDDKCQGKVYSSEVNK